MQEFVGGSGNIPGLLTVINKYEHSYCTLSGFAAGILASLPVGKYRCYDYHASGLLRY